MAIEAKRGCGFRQVGGTYLVADGIWVSCDRLPFPIPPVCDCCGEGVRFPRAPWPINPVKLFGNHGEDCQDDPVCPVCFPEDGRAFLLGVGEKYYTMESFINEANRMGVSKKVPHIPKDFEVGKSRFFLVYKKGIETGEVDEKGRPVHQMAVFSSFIPQRIETLIWKSEATPKKLAELEKRGITAVVIPDGDEDHAPGRKRKAEKVKPKVDQLDLLEEDVSFKVC